MRPSPLTPEERQRVQVAIATLERCLAPAAESLEEWMNRAVYGKSQGAYVPKALVSDGWGESPC